MIKSYKHIVWDWNGTIFCDVDLVIEIMHELLRQQGIRCPYLNRTAPALERNQRPRLP